MEIIYANSENFKSEIATGKVVVDFYADWCGPCQMLSPILEELNQEIADLKIVKVDVDNSQDIAMEYGVMSMPTMILFKDGEKKDQKIGLSSKEDLKTWIEAN